jgi:uncharacterized membrane protein YjgN (DUF898 family)
MTFEDTPATRLALAEAAAKTAVPAVPAPSRPVRFVGDSRAFWRLLLRGALLLAVTLGIYRFWLATDVRRFLWSNTEIAGDSLEYNGTATELLIGFLIALALLLPLNLMFFVLALGMGPVGGFAGVLGFAILFVLGQFAIYRARRYRLTRTVLRGVRFHQTGAAWRYAVYATLWWVLIVVTIGLAYPFARASLERYKMRHTHYGDLPGRFEGSGFRLFLRGVLMWVLVVGPFVIGIVAAIIVVDWSELGRLSARRIRPEPAQLEGAVAGAFIAGAGVAASLAMAVLLYPVFQAMVLRWWLSGIRFGELTVQSHLLKRRIYGAYVRFVLYGALFSLVAGLIAAAGALVFSMLSSSFTGTGIEIIGTGAAVLLYVVMMLGYSTIYQATVRLALWRHGVESLEIEGLAVLDRVKAAGKPSSTIGEGLADALDVGGI